MEKLIILGTSKTPFVNFDATGQLEIGGTCIPEKPNEFFRPLFDWLSNLLSERPENINLIVKFDHFNTASSKSILKLFAQLEDRKYASNVVVNWYYEYEDEDMREAGEEYSDLFEVKFNIIGYELK
jgi:SiaC family regulatory phosphoprotein